MGHKFVGGKELVGFGHIGGKLQVLAPLPTN